MAVGADMVRASRDRALNEAYHAGLPYITLFANKYNGHGMRVSTSLAPDAIADRMKWRNLGVAHARAQDAVWFNSLAEWNAGRAVADRNVLVFIEDDLNGYFKQGQAARGRLTNDLALAALRQWAIDAQPGARDRAMNVVGAIVALAPVAIVGASMAGVALSAAPAATPIASVPALSGAGAAASQVTVAGISTGLSSGVSLVDSIIGQSLTGGVTAAAAGGSGVAGLKQGATQAAGAAASGAIQAAVPVSLQGIGGASQSLVDALGVRPALNNFRQQAPQAAQVAQNDQPQAGQLPDNTNNTSRAMLALAAIGGIAAWLVA